MIRRLLHYSSPEARRLLVVELAFIVATAVLQGMAFVVLVPLLRALFSDDMAAVRSWLIALAVIGLVYVVVFWFASQFGMKASTAVLDSLLRRLGDRLVDLPIAWFGVDRSGLMAGLATQGATFVASAPYAVVRLIITGFVTPATVLVGMYFFDWRLALATTATVPVLWLAFRWLRDRIGRGDADHSAATAEASNRVIEFARAQPVLRTAADGSIAGRLVDDALRRQHHAYRGVLMTGGAGIAAFAAVVQLALTVIIVLGAHLAIGGSLDPATLIALLVLGVRFTEPIANSGALGGGVAVAQTTLDHLDDLYSLDLLPEPAEPAIPNDPGIAFDDVTFGYGGAPVLRHLSFTAPAGRMTAIVGPSGSGKVTFLAYAGGVCALAAVGWYPAALLLWAAWSFASTLAITNAITVRQQLTPDDLQGRVNTTARMIAWGGTPFGAALGGVTADAFGITIAYLALAVPVLAGVAILLRSPVRTLRSIDHRRP